MATDPRFEHAQNESFLYSNKETTYTVEDLNWRPEGSEIQGRVVSDKRR